LESNNSPLLSQLSVCQVNSGENCKGESSTGMRIQRQVKDDTGADDGAGEH